jgi:hypothetical protein
MYYHAKLTVDFNKFYNWISWWIMVFSDTLNNWLSVFLVEENDVNGENHRPAI